MFILLGIALGVACATPMLYALRVLARDAQGMGLAKLLACCLAPFFVLQTILFAARVVVPDVVVPLGVSAVLTFVAVAFAGVLHAWWGRS